MQTLLSPYILIMVVAAVICMFIAGYVLYRRRKNSETLPLLLLLVLIIEWIAAALLGLVDQNLAHKILWAKIEYIGVVSVPLAVLVYVANHSGANWLLPLRRLVWLGLIPAVTLVLVWTNEFHGLIWAKYLPYRESGLVLSEKAYGPGFWIYLAYSYLILLAATVLTLRVIRVKAEIFRWQSILVLIGILTPWMGNLLHVVHIHPFMNLDLDLTPLAFSITGIALAAGMFRWGLFDIKPIAYSAVIAGMVDGVIILDSQDRIVEVNQAAPVILGLTAQQMVGKQLEEAVANRLPLDERSSRIKEQSIAIKLTFRRDNQEYELSDSPFFEESGALGGRIIFLHDVTERKRLEERLRATERKQADMVLRESEDKFKYVFEYSSVGKSFTRPSGEIQVNKAFCDMLGYSAEELRSIRWQEITHPDDIEITQREVNALLTGEKEAAHFVKRYLRKDGGAVWTDVSTSLRRDAQGKPLYFMTTIVDITERKRAEEAVRLHTERVQVLLKLNQMTAVTYQQLTDYALEEAVRITQSEIGYLAFLNDDESILTMHAWSKLAMKECAIIDKPIQYVVTETGLWGEAVRQRRPVITNDYAAPNPAKKGYPQGHVPLHRHMNVPVYVGQHIVLVAGVGNKAGEYNNSDAEQLTLLMEGMWRLIERKQAEEALKKSQSLLAETEKMGKVGGWEFDIATQEQTWTEEVYRIHEVDMTYKPSVENGINFYLPGSRLLIEQAVQRAIEQGESFDMELEIITAKGNLRKVHAIAKADLEHHRVFGFFQDITERKQIEEDLERSNAELEQFAYVASHDLQEPVRMVASYLQLLQRRYKGRLDADADDFIGFAVDGAARMQRMINDLLAFSRIGTHGKPFASTSGEGALVQALENLQVTIAENHAQITHDPLPAVLADESQLVQLFQNLIGNAIKYHGDAQPQVNITAAEQPQEWVFAVRDNGIGIDAQYFERIFVIFQRLHSHDQYPGTGIGLAMCKKIVLRHGGRIWVESSPGRGATFYFTLPKTVNSDQ